MTNQYSGLHQFKAQFLEYWKTSKISALRNGTGYVLTRVVVTSPIWVIKKSHILYLTCSSIKTTCVSDPRKKARTSLSVNGNWHCSSASLFPWLRYSVTAEIPWMMKTQKVGFFTHSFLIVCFAEAFWAIPLLDAVSMACFQNIWVILLKICSLEKLGLGLRKIWL